MAVPCPALLRAPRPAPLRAHLWAPVVGLVVPECCPRAPSQRVLFPQWG